jgi:hypothetical protein
MGVAAAGWKWIALGVASLGLVSVAFPIPASAARIELRSGQVPGTTELVYTGGPGEVNDPGLQHSQDWYYLQDSAGPLTERVSPCEADPQQFGLGVTSRCPDPANAIASAVIDLGDGDDFGDLDRNTLLYLPVIVLGGPGRDRLSMHSFGGNVLDGGSGDDVISSEGPNSTTPTGGRDTVLGGDGNDEIHTRDDKSDVVSCGSGLDEVTADELDEIGSDCEKVDRGFEAPWVRADGKPIGVTINKGALYTNSADVRLTVRAPDAARHVRISNDGGFGSGLTALRDSSEVYGFELASSGPERLPKTVYVRFDGPDLDPNRSFSDDIVLDETRPAIRFARLVRRTRRGVRIVLRGRDAISGVKTAQFAHRRSRPWARIRYRRHVTVRRAPRWVRVRDGAGNASRWRRVSR